MKRRSVLHALGAGLIAASTPWKSLAATSGSEAKGNHMIIVTVEVEFEDDQIHQRRDAIRAMDEATAQEVGCLAYKSSFDVANPNTLRIYEMWESMDVLIPHFKTPHMAEFQAALSGLSAKRMDAKVFEISRELPFPN